MQNGWFNYNAQVSKLKQCGSIKFAGRCICCCIVQIEISEMGLRNKRENYIKNKSSNPCTKARRFNQGRGAQSAGGCVRHYVPLVRIRPNWTRKGERYDIEGECPNCSIKV
jgi:L-lactate utilization protein LutB